MLNYQAFNVEVFNKVPSTATKTLDIGCGTGEMGKALKAKYPQMQIDGVTYSEDERSIAAAHLGHIIVADLNRSLPMLSGRYDCMIFSHILEHTLDPSNVLKHFSKNLIPGGTIIVALPNVLQFKQRFSFLRGNFKYSEIGGLMDVTHFRFFDWLSAQEMISKAGLNITSKASYGNFPFLSLRKIAPGLCAKADQQFLKFFPGLFGFQFVFTAKNKI
ncbi:class I SAM-dependent methyltransferase [Mucilaginibacter myungsuensis]|uniref:Class I SAM-dependent methyltransferase n=1 Tax=Mucilaginibacter myungsuensis TaxID=649104 RepID=A0A929KXC5_9SPHI|nr:class I SAM-dependent methyltransferase [Mucilaginibacter myungsuensis]MBE9660390.1 class I SAM-dependent methyltransferase [Mucilaginibacter myungsuensis]MDN3600432.1 class I SAM-dependent methyltransferase [Mucilaginibacter myungsuensis]